MTDRKMGSIKGAKKKADVLFSKIVRSRGVCESCGETDYSKFHCAHIISRRYSHTRCDERNAYCLCAKCHAHFTDHPAEFGMFVAEKTGDDVYWELARISRLTGKVDWVATATELKIRWETIEAAA